jgi:transcription elongation factor GreA
VADVTKLSQDAFDRLQAEYDDLTTRGRIEIAHKIEAARELGDLSENGDYHAAKEQQGQMEARIRQLQGILQDAVVVEPVTAGGAVSVGSMVEIRFPGDDDTEKYLVGHIEERHDDLEVLSPESPLGSELVGRRAGEDATYEVNGNTLTVKIVSVE